MTAPSSWDGFWQQLRAKGWRVERGPRGDPYYFPPGVARGSGKRNRVDYFDSKLQVLRSLRDKGAVVVEVGDDSDAEEEHLPPHVAAGEQQKRRVAETGGSSLG